MTDPKKLRELTEKTTPGKRVLAKTWQPHVWDIEGPTVRDGDGVKTQIICQVYGDDDANFAAALDRETVLTLLDVVDAAVAYMDARGDDNGTFMWLREAVRRIRDGQGGV